MLPLFPPCGRAAVRGAPCAHGYDVGIAEAGGAARRARGQGAGAGRMPSRPGPPACRADALGSALRRRGPVGGQHLCGRGCAAKGGGSGRARRGAACAAARRPAGPGPRERLAAEADARVDAGGDCRMLIGNLRVDQRTGRACTGRARCAAVGAQKRGGRDAPTSRQGGAPRPPAKRGRNADPAAVQVRQDRLGARQRLGRAIPDLRMIIRRTRSVGGMARRAGRGRVRPAVDRLPARARGTAPCAAMPRRIVATGRSARTSHGCSPAPCRPGSSHPGRTRSTRS